MMSLGLSEGDKFAILAIKSVRSTIQHPCMLGDCTRVLTDLRAVIDTQPHWKEWLGSLRVDSLLRANILLVRSAPSPNPEILDAQHEGLRAYLTKVFYVLRLGVVIEYEGAEVIVGSFQNNEIQIRHVSELPDFRPTGGSAPEDVTLGALQRAVNHVTRLEDIESQLPNYARLMRGLNTLMEGLRHKTGQDRIHQFVRSLEALIVPETGKTRRQFVDRSKSFANAGKGTDQALAEAFDMRSDTEHLGDWDKSLLSYPPNDRMSVALLRTRQMERLACFAYCKVLDDPELGRNFETESSAKKFWSMTEADRRKAVVSGLDLSTVS